MTKEELAQKLDGMEYCDDVPRDLEKIARDHGLVIVYGASDDLMELRGAINDEGSCYEGGEFLIDRKGLLPDRDDIDDDDELEKWFARKKTSKTIEAVFCARDEPSWTFKTTIPHATFNMKENNAIECRGMVFNITDL